MDNDNQIKLEQGVLECNHCDRLYYPMGYANTCPYCAEVGATRYYLHEQSHAEILKTITCEIKYAPFVQLALLLVVLCVAFLFGVYVGMTDSITIGLAALFGWLLGGWWFKSE